MAFEELIVGVAAIAGAGIAGYLMGQIPAIPPTLTLIMVVVLFIFGMWMLYRQAT